MSPRIPLICLVFECDLNVFFDTLLVEEWIPWHYGLVNVAELVLIVPEVDDPQLFVHLFVLLHLRHLILIAPFESAQLAISNLLDLLVVVSVLFAVFILHLILEVQEIVASLLFLNFVDQLLVDLSSIFFYSF